MKVILAKFPQETSASLRFSNIEIEMSYTYLGHLKGLLETAPRSDSFDRDTRALIGVLGVMLSDMLEVSKSREQSPAEKELLLKRAAERGVGYHSTWMNEADPFPAT